MDSKEFSDIAPDAFKVHKDQPPAPDIMPFCWQLYTDVYKEGYLIWNNLKDRYYSIVDKALADPSVLDLTVCDNMYDAYLLYSVNYYNYYRCFKPYVIDCSVEGWKEEFKRALSVAYGPTRHYIDVTCFKPVNLTDLSYAFSVDERHIDTSGPNNLATNVERRLMGITQIVGFNSWDISKVTNMSGMFLGNTSLSEISGMEEWDVSNIKSFKQMFAYTNIIPEINITRWRPSAGADMTLMFENTRSLIDMPFLRNWNVGDNINDKTALFFRNNIAKYICNNFIKRVIPSEISRPITHSNTPDELCAIANNHAGDDNCVSISFGVLLYAYAYASSYSNYQKVKKTVSNVLKSKGVKQCQRRMDNSILNFMTINFNNFNKVIDELSN